MKNQLKISSFLTLLFFFTIFVGSKCYANFSCYGPVNGVSVDSQSGDIIVQSLAGITWPRLCSVSTTSNNVTPERCKIVYATLMAAQISNRPVTIYFTSANTCASLPQWQFSPGFYFLTMN